MGIELHTDRLKRETGSAIVCKVLSHDTTRRTRVALLQADASPNRTTQVTAFTRLTPHYWSARITTIDHLLKQGGLMGETFRNQGLAIQQNRLLCLKLPVGSGYISALYGCKWWTITEVECYEFWANDSLYGIVLEIKKPGHTAPPRPARGSYKAWRLTGKTPAKFTEQLQLPPKGFALPIAKVWGVIIALPLYVQACMYKPR